MNLKAGAPVPSKKSLGNIMANVFASLVALFGIALLVINVMSFQDNVNYYLAQGYPSAEVIWHLVPSQLLPGMFEPIGIYGGIAFLLFYVGKIDQKISKYVNVSAECESCDDIGEECVSQDSINDEDIISKSGEIA